MKSYSANITLKSYFDHYNSLTIFFTCIQSNSPVGSNARLRCYQWYMTTLWCKYILTSKYKHIQWLLRHLHRLETIWHYIIFPGVGAVPAFYVNISQISLISSILSVASLASLWHLWHLCSNSGISVVSPPSNFFQTHGFSYISLRVIYCIH